jgi:hypothetical protein
MVSDLNRLIQTFKNMNSDGFDTTGALKWGFFFIDTKKERLTKVFGELCEHEYNLEGIEKTRDGLWQLYVTKIDTLTPEKLHERNFAFNELAEYCNVQLYDGWDVEKATV